MPFHRTTAAVLLVAASIPALASPSPDWTPTPGCQALARDVLYALSLPPDADDVIAEPKTTDAILDDAVAAVGQQPAAKQPPRELVVAFAMTLRDIRYRRGGRAPTTGFDCSGFVQYVFAHALGIELPDDSASQFHAGTAVARKDLQTGDLVFFHTRGKNVSHVGIYLDNGRFIHSPSTGKRVRVDELGDHYWAARYLGAKRPTTLT